MEHSLDQLPIFRSRRYDLLKYVCLLMKTQDSQLDSRRRIRSSEDSCMRNACRDPRAHNRSKGLSSDQRTFWKTPSPASCPAKPVVQNLNRTPNSRARSSFRKLFRSSPRAPPSELVPNSSPGSLSTVHRPCTKPTRVSADLPGVTNASHGHGNIICLRARQRPQNFVLLHHRPKELTTSARIHRHQSASPCTKVRKSRQITLIPTEINRSG